MQVVAMTSTSTSPSHAEARLNPTRITLARELRGISKTELARVLGMTTRALQDYESLGAPKSRQGDLADALGVEPSFFALPERERMSPDQGFFRALRRATAGQRHAAIAAADVGVELYEWLAERFVLPKLALPDLDDQEPEAASAALRSVWGRGQEPMPNLIQLAEAHGVRVLSIPPNARTVDAFSTSRDGQAYVFLSTEKSAERSRFDLAHELGHLVMHTRVPPGHIQSDAELRRQIEQEADAFASALLMPRSALLADASREPAVPEILRLKSRYRVSAMAMTRRLHDVGRLSDWSYRQNCVQLAQLGYRSSEPGGMRRDLSRVFAIVFPTLRAQGIGSGSLRDSLGLTAELLHDLTFGQVTISVNGLDQTTVHARPSLRVIQGGA